MKDIYFKKLNIKIKAGELVSIIGPNSCGKTTFLKNISGMCNRNYMCIDNKDVKDYSIEYKKNNIVCVFNDNKYMTTNVNDELFYYLNILNHDLEKVSLFVEYFSLNDIINSLFSKLSNEDRIYIKILSLLIIEPSIFCIDDLLTYLSVEKKMKILNYIKDHNITLLSVVSNMEDLLLFDKVIVYNKERVIKFDNVSKILLEENIFKELGLSLPFIYDLNNMLASYELINEKHLNYKELVDMLWK